MLDLLIITVPYIYSYGPSLAPALLKSCAVQEGITAEAWDYGAEFNHCYEDSPNFIDLKNWFEISEYQISQQQFDWYIKIVKDCVNVIKKKNPKYIGLSLLTLNSCRFAEDLCFHLKILAPEIKIIIGGGGQEIFLFQHQKRWNQLMIDNGLADCCIVGEGEFLLATVVKNNLTGIHNAPQLSNSDLGSIPVPDYSDYNFSLYKNTNKNSYWSTEFFLEGKDNNDIIFLITSSKGCVKNCNFCDVNKIWPKFRYRPGKFVAQEIIELNKKYGATFFSFTDSLLNGGLKSFNELNYELASKLPNTIKYEGQFIARSQKDMPEHYFELMSRAGCYNVSVGVESGSEAVRMHMGKGSTQDDIHYTTEMFTKYKIFQHWNIIAGYPTETEQDWLDTLNLVKYWLHHSKNLLRIDPINTFLLLDGTPVTTPESLNSLQISNDPILGYSDFNWVSALNPTNTFDVRAGRFLELCKYLIEFDPYYRNTLQRKINAINRQLEFYNQYAKKKKIFIINNN